MEARFGWIALALALVGCDHPADMKDRDVDGRRAGSPTAAPAGERQGDTLGGADSFPSGNSTAASGAGGGATNNTLMVMVDPTARDGRPVDHLVATVHGTPENPKIRGTVHFRRTGDTVSVTSDVQGLPAGDHGYHVHVYGDCSAPASKSMGAHLDFMALSGTPGAGAPGAAGATPSQGMTDAARMTGATGATGNPARPDGMTTGTTGPSGMVNGAGGAATSAGADGAAGTVTTGANGVNNNGGRGAPGADGASSAGEPGSGAISGNKAVDAQPGLRGTTSQSGQPVHPPSDATATGAVRAGNAVAPADATVAGAGAGAAGATGAAGAAGTGAHAGHITGNLGQLTGAANGTAQTQQTVAGLGGGMLSLLNGRSVVIHAGPNDPAQPPDGGAGDPIACGVIGVASGETAPAAPRL